MGKKKKKERAISPKGSSSTEVKGAFRTLHLGYSDSLDLKGFVRFKQKENKKVIILYRMAKTEHNYITIMRGRLDTMAESWRPGIEVHKHTPA